MHPLDGERTQAVKSLFTQLDLPAALWELISANPSRGLPYHGQQHLFSVALLSQAGAKHYALELEAQQQLLLASLFHDFSYSVGASEDRNIPTAVKAMEKALEAIMEPNGLATVKTLIEATRYPHEVLEYSQELPHLLKCIMQDADTLQLTVDDHESFLAALEEETGKPADPLFPGLAHLTTPWGKDLYTATIAQREGTHS